MEKSFGRVFQETVFIGTIETHHSPQDGKSVQKDSNHGRIGITHAPYTMKLLQPGNPFAAPVFSVS
ncbi:MAG: hypothetical protein MI684_03915 [Chlorobiales bacterium]|nr:hypothetical protein [Chlorobiales bacterium]